jgi:hypothetical protein
MMWKPLLTWLPGGAAALGWVTLNGLIQPWLSHAGVQLYTDAALLLIPARYFPVWPAVCVTGFGTLCADAFRDSPFGLSASLLLPVLLALAPVQRTTRRWDNRRWTLLAIGINTLAWLALAWMWTLDAMAADIQAALLGTAAGAAASAAFIFLAAPWFMSLQIALFEKFGMNLKAAPPP